MCVGGGQGSLRGRYEAMGQKQSEGLDTEKKETLLKRLSFSVCEILHFAAHFKRAKKPPKSKPKKHQTPIWGWRYSKTSLL